MNVYSGDPQVTASLVGVTSSSCPADLTQKRELTGMSPGSWQVCPQPWSWQMVTASTRAGWGCPVRMGWGVALRDAGVL